MLSAAKLKDQIPNRIREQLTPRRRRQGLIFLAIFTVYSVLGLFAVPGLVISQAQKFVHEKLKLELTIAKLEINPWLLAVRIDGLKIKEPGVGGETLVAAKSVYVNAQLWSSIWIRGASLAEVDLLAPYINARIRRDGSINLLQLMPPDDGKDSNAHWRIGQLGVHGGHVDFRDNTRATPFTAFFSPLNLGLSDLSSRPEKDGGYTLHAETGDGETLDWHGTVSMKPIRSQGELRISRLKATTPWRYMQDALPVVVDGGLITIAGHYRLTAGDAPEFSLEKGRIIIDDMALHQRGARPLALELKQLDLNGVNLQWPAQTVGFSGLSLQGFHLVDKEAGNDLSSFGRLQLQDGRYLSAPKRFELATVSLQQLILEDGAGQSPLITLPALTLEKLGITLDERHAHIDHITLAKGDISMRREKNGTLNWVTRLDELTQRLATMAVAEKAAQPGTVATPAEKPATKKSGPAKEKTWIATLGELDLRGFRVALEDQVPRQAVKNSLEDINLRIFPQQTSKEPHALEGHLTVGSGGTLAFKGKFSEQPLAASADLDLQSLELPSFAPYFEDVASFSLESGALDVAGTFNFLQGKTTTAGFNGRIAVRHFSANDLVQDERFLAWSNLAINGLSWQLSPGKLGIRDIQADKPFIRVIIAPDKTLNLSHIVVAAPEKTGAATITAAESPRKTADKTARVDTPYPLRIDRIRMKDGSMLFADFTLKPQFATGIQSLNGDISGISTDPKTRAKVALSGRVDQYGKADINGTVNPLASEVYTDIAVKFSNLELTTLTPYSAKFAGYRIDKGKLSLDLNYRIENRQLNATNKVVFNQLTLGDKVDSPDSIGLPLKLAVAILKDKDGVIDVDLPITGSIDDPKFKLAPLIWKAFLNLLTKAATAPFSLIAGMVGGGSDLDSLSFATGESALAPAETDKLDKLARALGERPALGVEIRGAFDPQADALAIKTVKFNSLYEKRLGAGDKPQTALEALFAEKMGKEALAQQRALHLKPAADTAKNKNKLELDVDAYLQTLRTELIAREVVLDGDLRQLALARAGAVRRQLVEINKIGEDRIFVLEPVSVQATDKKIVMKVALTAS
ncbi:MAG: DUF748 domain-containing protein [bacterium]|nr:DUF748 domain-containing protein [bacterium]